MVFENPFSKLFKPVFDATWAKTLAPPFVFVVCQLFRSPDLLLNPRFWAEEGNLYYAQMQHLAVPSAFLHIVNGNYQFLTNVMVEVALALPVRNAAYATTYLSLAMTLCCCWMIADFLVSRGVSTWIASAACALFALQPAGYEVFLSATNAQWVASVIGLLLCVSEDVPALGWRAARRYAGLAICGLTGTTTCILLPLFLVGAVRRRNAFGWGMVVVLAAAAAIQGAIVLAHHDEMRRTFALHWTTPVTFVAQVVFAQVLPPNVFDLVSHALPSGDPLAFALSVQIVAIGLAAIVGVTILACRTLGVFEALTLSLGTMFACFVNEFGSLQSQPDVVSGWWGARYFFLGATGFLVATASCMAYPASRPVRAAGATLVGLIFLNSLNTVSSADWTSIFLSGTSLADQVAACPDVPECPVFAWPMSGGRFKLLVKHP